ncbi:MAG: DUF2877 domain-containing protein [Nitrososphaeria archaeon]
MTVPHVDYVSSCIGKMYAGHVIQVFEGAINVLGDGPLWILGPLKGPQPLGVRLNFLPELRNGDPVLRNDNILRLGKNYELDLKGAEIWSTSSMSLNNIREETYNEVTQWAKRYSVQPDYIDALTSGNVYFHNLDGQVISRLREVIINAIIGAGFKGAKELIGLGTGLTPSGDDALVGMLASLKGSDHFYMLGEKIKNNLKKTNWISQGYLQCAISGEFGWEASRVIRACTGTDDLEDSIRLASRVGNSSGSFFMLGFIGGLIIRLALLKSIHS